MDIIKSIRVYVRNRNIHKANPIDRYLQVVGKTEELEVALKRDNLELIKSSIGGMVIALVALCETLDIDFNECIHREYDEIKDSKSQFIDGTFMNGRFIKAIFIKEME